MLGRLRLTPSALVCNVAAASPSAVDPEASGQRRRRGAWAESSDAAHGRTAQSKGRRELDIFCGNPMVQTVRARVHLYTRRYDIAGGGAGGAGGGAGAVAVGVEQQLPTQTSDQQHYNLFVLAVPSYLSPADFCSFVGPELMATVLHMRVVRDEDASRYMVLLQMRDHSAAEELRQMKNGAKFSSLMAGGASPGASEEGETCYVLYIEQLLWEQHEGGGGDRGDRARPRLTCDGDVAVSLAMGGPSESSGGSGRVSPVEPPPLGLAKALSPPAPPGHVEVPRCPVCLERLDPHASGILTVLCNHSFHSECLTKWGDSTCPVCRYAQPL